MGWPAAAESGELRFVAGALLRLVCPDPGAAPCHNGSRALPPGAPAPLDPFGRAHAAVERPPAARLGGVGLVGPPPGFISPQPAPAARATRRAGPVSPPDASHVAAGPALWPKRLGRERVGQGVQRIGAGA